jgi:membrane protease YdiL (CAAX protease family)
VAIVLAYLCIAYVIVLGFFHPLHRRRAGGDFEAYLRYFAAFFIFFFLGPCILLILTRGATVGSLGAIGLGAGKPGRGLPLVALGVPVAILAGWVGSRDPALRDFYPFSKEALRSVRSFVFFELAYVLLYYPAWEFLYRGVLFFPLIPAIGLVPALGVETVLSTLYHIGHPPSEVLAAAGAGVIFGLLAFWTGSFFYTALLHAAVGVSTDTFVFLRFRERKAG